MKLIIANRKGGQTKTTTVHLAHALAVPVGAGYQVQRLCHGGLHKLIEAHIVDRHAYEQLMLVEQEERKLLVGMAAQLGSPSEADHRELRT